MEKEQMELSFGTVRGHRSMTRRERRLNQANWWFERMRQVVDRAFDWQPTPPPRPEQIWFRGGTLPAPGAAVEGEVREVCE